MSINHYVFKAISFEEVIQGVKAVVEKIWTSNSEKYDKSLGLIFLRLDWALQAFYVIDQSFLICPKCKK